MQGAIVGLLVMHRGRALGRRLQGGHHGRQVLDLQVDQFGRIPGLVGGFRHHHGDRLAGEADLVDRQGRALGLENRCAVKLGQRDVGDEFAGALGLHVLAGEHAEHARRGQGLLGIDGDDSPMGIG